VSKDDEETRNPGAKYLDGILIALGFKGNAELSRLTGVSEGLLWKWRSGAATPTSKNLRKVVSVIVPMAEAVGIPVDPVEFYVRFELITREEIEGERIDEMFLELVRLDREAGDTDPEIQHRLREMTLFLIEGIQQQLDQRRAANPGTGRDSKAM
jgi:transcriptional regulator with XRE-family HTH domain